ncbi:methionine ABC transporter permease [Thermoactinomyces sp. DSM 45892]|uniref:methionine ABC transporter permease n=1 Tax=Thermoactinomyces sp. DSM 45892 TaxID=1882753 RepID=UPI000896FB28|nr:D-methionine transport system permease protein [Thermoactinomyces sp. DSM 45892]
MLNQVDWVTVWQATLDTLQMVGISTLFTVLLGLPLGVLLVITNRGHLWENQVIHKSLAFVVNVFRGVPFIVLILLLFPLSTFLIGTSLGPTAATIPLTVAAAPFFARMVETSLLEVDRGTLEVAHAMGANRFTIIRKVLLAESLPAIISGITVTCVSLIGYSAFAGIVGGGGLGDVALRVGFQSFNNEMLLVCSFILVAIVQIVQWIGDAISRKVDHR